jgi:transposase
MSRPYRMDLRERLVRAVEKEGFSRRPAAVRFGVAPSTTVNWLKRALVRGRSMNCSECRTGRRIS